MEWNRSFERQKEFGNPETGRFNSNNKKMKECINERIKRQCDFLSSSKFVDATFIVGQQNHQKRFEVHRLLLASESDVFEKMLYASDFIEHPIIYLTDIEPVTFESIVKYIYTKKFDPKIADPHYVYRMANKYKIHHLYQLCRDYLENHLNAHNVCQIYESSIEFQDELLLMKCRDVIMDEAQFIFQSDRHTTLTTMTMEEILKQSMWINSEAILFDAVIRWAKAKCKDRVRLLITPFLSYIRFLTLTEDQFGEGPEKSGFISRDEASRIRSNILKADSVDLPPWCNKTRLMRYPYKICSLECILCREWCEWNKNIGCVLCVKESDIDLYGIGFAINRRMKYSLPEHTSLIVSSDRENVYQKSRIKFCHRTGICSILCLKPLSLKKGLKYDIQVDTTFFPPSMIYQNCEANFEITSYNIENLVFFFYNHGKISENNLVLMNVHQIFYIPA